MAVHNIMLPDRLRGDELRSIVWDDEAGTVEGEHYRVPDIRDIFDAPKPVIVGHPGRTWSLRDPGRDPSEFLALLGQLYWPVLEEPLRSTLPPVFDGVEIPPGEKGEILYDEAGRELT